MSKQTNPNADAVEANEGSFFDQLDNFELGPLPSNHETTSDEGELGGDKDPTDTTVIEPNSPDTTGDEGDNTDDERGNNPPNEDDSTDEGNAELPQGSDERVVALMDLMRAEQLLASDVEIDPTVENIPKVMDSVALHLFQGYVKDMPPLARDLITYLSQSADFNVDQARQFFDQYLAPSATFSVPQDEDQAVAYLQDRLSKEGIFPTDDALQTYLDDLLEKGKLMDIAVPRAEKEKAAMDAQRSAELERVEAEKQQVMEQSKAYYQSIFDTIESQSWRDDRKAKVRQAVDPKQVQAINTKVRKSPMAVSQLALLYSFFDEETQSFDLSAFAQAHAGKEVAKIKNDLKNKSVEAALNRFNTRSADTDDTDKRTGFFTQMTPAE